jgi:hypothetical protein
METNNDIIRELLQEVKEIKAVMTDPANTNASEKWLDNTDVREMLHLSVRTLQRLRDSGKLKHSKINGKIFYRLSDVHAMLMQNQIA